tara:strand:+ start:18998 stop:19882 length:885 start_codon:yes stop_codon:yes gene_type:complete
MSKGVAALSYLDPTSIAIVTGGADCSINAIKAGLNKVAHFQEVGTTTGTFAAEVCRTNDPFTTATWDFVLAVSTDTAATATATCASVLAADTVTVNGLLYTAVSGARANDTEFSIDTSDTACALDLAAAITADTRTGTLNDVTAVSAIGVVTMTTSVAGTAGNATTLVSSNGTRLAVTGSGFFTGGVDPIAFQMTFNTEVSNVITTIGRPALANRRLVDPVLVTNTNLFSVRSLLAAVNFMEKLEDKVASTGSGASGDGTYTNVALNGHSPFESFNWTIVKSGNDYTFTPLAGS